MRLKNKDIADILGISTTAVSLALNNRPGVSENTRRRVLELVSDSTMESIQALNNESNLENRSILLCVHKKHGRIINDKPFFSDVIEAAQQELQKQSYNMILSHYVPEQSLPQYIQYIQGLPVAGLILMATEMDTEDLAYYKQLNLPMVLMDGCFELEQLDSVTLDNQTAVLRAFHYVARMGHRQIGYLRSATPISNFAYRMDGFMKGLRECGLENENHPIITLPCDVQGAHREMAAFLEHPPEGFKMPTVFLSDLDYIALGAMSAMKERGIRIPEDVSIVGYDDVAISTASEPPLTTVRVNHSDIGRFAARSLLDRISYPRECNTLVQVSSRLIVRKSVRSMK